MNITRFLAVSLVFTSTSASAQTCDATWVQAFKTNFDLTESEQISEKTFKAFCKRSAEASSNDANFTYAGFGFGQSSSRAAAHAACAKTTKDYSASSFRRLAISYLPSAAIDTIGRACGGGLTARASQIGRTVIVEAAYYGAPGVAQTSLLPIVASQDNKALQNLAVWPQELKPNGGVGALLRDILLRAAQVNLVETPVKRPLTTDFQVLGRFVTNDVRKPTTIYMNTSGAAEVGKVIQLEGRHVEPLTWTVSPIEGKKKWAQCISGNIISAELKLTELAKFPQGKCRVIGGVASVFDPGQRSYTIGFTWLAEPAKTGKKGYECFRTSATGKPEKLPGLYNGLGKAEIGKRFCAEFDSGAVNAAVTKPDEALRMK